MIAHALERAGHRNSRPRFLVADWIVTQPFAQPLLARLGGVRACPENAERLLTHGHSVVVFPEGQKGALKPFRDRYKLQRFARGGFVSLALQQNTSIVPVAVVGAEEAHPILFRPKLPSRLLGFPIPITPTFPLAGPLGLVPLPSQWRIRFGEPVHFTDEDRDKSDEPLFINRMRDQIRNRVQGLLEEEVHRRRGVFS
jgi:1-acyl-sn-glycerol-3-phosphate acyltransferase